MAEREAWLAVVQHSDRKTEQDTELVTIERSAAGAPPVIELTDGTRITCTEPATPEAV